MFFSKFGMESGHGNSHLHSLAMAVFNYQRVCLGTAIPCYKTGTGKVELYGTIYPQFVAANDAAERISRLSDLVCDAMVC